MEPINHYASPGYSLDKRVTTQPPWTTARCQRLLRPLKNSVRSLRQHQSRSSALPSSDRSGHRDTGDARQKRAQQHTYSKRKFRTQRGGHTESPKPYSALQYCQTRFMLADGPRQKIEERSQGQKCRHFICSQPLPFDWPNSPEAPEACLVEREMGFLRSLTTSYQYRIYESIMQDLDAVLRATVWEAEAPEPAPKSMLAMCLRKVPECIAHQEAFEQQEAEENRSKTVLDESNVSDSIYSFIQSRFSIIEGGGCRYLRTLVRAEAFRLISQLPSSQHMLNVDFCCAVVAVCKAHRVPLREVEGIITSIADLRVDSPEKQDADLFSVDSMRPLYIPKYTEPAYTALRHRVLSRVLLNDNLPLAWVRTRKFNMIWEESTERFSEKASCGDVMELMANVIALVSNHKSVDGPERLLESIDQSRPGRFTTGDIVFPLLVCLATAVIYPWNSEASRTFGPVIRAEKRVRHIIDTSLCELQRGHKHIRKQLMAYVLGLTGLLSSHTWVLARDNSEVSEAGSYNWRWTAVVKSTWSDLNRNIDETRRDLFYNKTKMLVCELAKSCSVFEEYSRMEHLMHYCDQIDQLRIPALEHLRFDAAFYLADLTGKFGDRSFAESLTKDSGNIALSKWRWDDGISEWVTKTPVAAAPTPAADGGRTHIIPSSPSPQIGSQAGVKRDFDELLIDNSAKENRRLSGGKKVKRLASTGQRQALGRISNQQKVYSSDDELGH